MKTLKTLKTILVVAGMALAGVVAQANSVPATLYQLNGASFSLLSTATYNGSEWDYVYTFDTARPIAIGSFVVEGVGATSFNTADLTLEPSTFPGTISGGPRYVTWSGNATFGEFSFSFLSPFAPIPGLAYAEGRGAQYESPNYPSANSLVPGVPDGGLTVAMLGMGLVGIQTLRRKLS